MFVGKWSSIRRTFEKASRGSCSARRTLTTATCLTAAILAAAIPPEVQAQDLIGVTSHFLHNSRFYPEMPAYWRVDLTMPFIKELGITTVHEGLYALAAGPRALITDGKADPNTLHNVERNRKQVGDWLAVYDASGIKVVLAIIGLPPSSGPRADANNAEFSAWVADLIAAHPSVVAVQLHNEPNLEAYWRRGTPEQYVETFRPYAQAIKAKRPDVKILFGAISSLWWPQGVSWLKRAIDHGAFDFADGIAIHPYNIDFPPEVDPHWRGAPASDPDQREKAIKAFYSQVVSWNRGRPFDLYFTEFGWNTATDGGAHVDERTQADYLARSFLIYMDLRLDGVPIQSAFWYDLKDDGLKPNKAEHRYGLLSYDLTNRKPSFWALKALAATFVKTDNFEKSAVAVDFKSAVPAVKVKSWRRKSDGAEIFVFWATAQSDDQNNEKMEIAFHNLNAKTALLHFASDQAPVEVPVLRNGNAVELEVPVSSRPSWIELLKN